MGKAIGAMGLVCCFAFGALLPRTTYAQQPLSVLANSVSGAAIVQTALKYVGYPYTTVGNSPSTGFSCIGYVSYVYQQRGIPLPDDLGLAQAYAPAVPFSDLLPGDILFFQNTVWTGLSHTAIYLGAGRFVHAEWYNRGVRVSSFYNDPVDGNYWIGKYLGANRPWAGAPGVISLPPLSPVPSGTATGSAGVSTSSPPLPNGSAAIVTVPALNMREDPSLQATIRHVLTYGTKVSVVDHQGIWYQITLANATPGWVIQSGIGAVPSVGTKSPAAPPVTSAGTSPGVHYPRIKVPVDQLRLHTAPDLTAPLVGVLRMGQAVDVLTQTHSWDRVRTPTGKIGWVSAPLLESRGSTVTAHKSATQAAVIVANVRVHRQPAVAAPVVTVAHRGTTVAVVNNSGTWVYIQLPAGVRGYVLSTFVHNT